MPDHAEDRWISVEDETSCAVIPLGVSVVTTPLRPDNAIGWRVTFMKVLCLSCGGPPVVLISLTGWVALGGGNVAEMSIPVPYALLEFAGRK